MPGVSPQAKNPDAQNELTAGRSDLSSAPERRRSRDASLRLSMVHGIGPRHFGDLIRQFGSAEKILGASAADLRRVNGVGTKLAREISLADTQIDVAPLIAQCDENRIEMLVRGDECYPEMLSQIHFPPNVLFVKGRIQPQDSLAVAIVGSRHASTYGLKVTETLARGLSLAGFTIVSGMARGIDAAAHRGALSAGGRTIAVLGSGLLNIYPPEHTTLAEEIAAQGAVISEYVPSQSPKSGAFPQRNRIVSGLSLGVVVVEAAARSGALISARLANEQGREVFAVPGRIDSRMSRGCHALIRDGAKLVESVDDIIEELGPLPAPAKTENGVSIRNPAELKLNEQESNILQKIDIEPTSVDVIIRETGLPTSRVLSTISVLEIRRLVRRVAGNKVVRV